MPTPAVVVAEPQAAPEPYIVQPTTRRARVKGTWTQYFGSQVFDFVDGHSYELPMDLFEYLRKHGNIYDTMA